MPDAELRRLRSTPAYMRRLMRLCRTPHRFGRRRCSAGLNGVDTPAIAHFAEARETLLSSRR